MEEAREELHSIVNFDGMTAVPVLVFANKQDLPNAIGINKLSERLHLRDLKSKWHVQTCCAVNGDGLLEGFENFSRMLHECKRNRY